VHANVILSNLRDAEGLAMRVGPRRAFAVAIGFLALAVTAALLGRAPALAALPTAMGAAVSGLRPGERYGALVVDGALLAGACVAYLAQA